MAKLDLSAHYDSQATALAADGEDAFAAVRRDALARFRELGLPSKRDEAWRYTETRALSRRAFLPAALLPGEPPTVPAAHELLDPMYELLIVDGRLVRCDAPVSLRALSRGDAVTAPTAQYDDGLAALQSAFLSDLIEIELAPGARLERPLLIRRQSSSPASSPRIACPTLRISLGAGADLILVEQQIGTPGSEDLDSVSLDLMLADAATLDWTRMRVGAAAGYRIDRCRASLGRNSRLRASHLDLAGHWNRSDLRVVLAGAGASVALDGLYLPQGTDLHDHHLEVVHAVPHTRSAQRYRGVLSGTSRAVFSGRVLIEAGAQHADASQENRNLLLSEGAEVDTKPELEIYADDVKASHGATVGQLDEASMFYLLSRGLDRETARALLVFAFADTVLTGLPSNALRLYVEAQLVAALPNAEVLSDAAGVRA